MSGIMSNSNSYFSVGSQLFLEILGGWDFVGFFFF